MRSGGTIAKVARPARGSLPASTNQQKARSGWHGAVDQLAPFEGTKNDAWAVCVKMARRYRQALTDPAPCICEQMAKDVCRRIGPIGGGKERAPFAITQIFALTARIEQRRRVSIVPAKAHGMAAILRHAPQ
jgi:hypothetical protein